ncbi:hypothetical protein HY497_00610 [Candidatus Woesearchaeota archaeon]|nr:hypothetical protein [Candidatus Woesearchaeota archaeon]
MFEKQGSATQQVLSLRVKGLTDNQVIEELQKRGLSTQQIFDAMSQADLAAAPDGDMPPDQFPEEYPAPPQQYAEPAQYPAAPDDDRIHEIAEAIINEKWDEVLGDIQKIVAWKDAVENDIQQLKDETAALKDEFNQLRQGILGKINESDASMRDVSSELKAVHQVFKEVIPSFTENVAELSRLTKKIKQK